MTCIVGLVHEGIAYIGADSLGSNGHSKTVRVDKKVFHMKDINNAIMGFTSSFRMGQLLMYGTGLIDSRDAFQKTLDHEYMVTKFVPNVISLFENGGYAKTNSGQKSGGKFLFGYKDKLYQIESDYQVGESVLGYDACGSGEEYALGSLHSTKGVEENPYVRIYKALKAASEFSVGCAPPFYVLNTENKNVKNTKNKKGRFY